MKVIVGREKRTCGVCQGRGHSFTNVWGYPNGKIPITAYAPLKLRRNLKLGWAAYLHRNPIDAPNAFQKRVTGCNHTLWRFRHGTQLMDSSVKSLWCLSSLLVAESYGWTIQTEREWEKRFKWFNE